MGSMVVAPLKQHSRIGVVVGFEYTAEHELEEIYSVAEGLSLREEMVDLCGWISENTALPLAVVVRAALPPGMDTGSYRVSGPLAGWPWREGALVRRAVARRRLGAAGLVAAEREKRLELVPVLPAPEETQWATLLSGANPGFKWTPKQKELLGSLMDRGAEYPAADLLSETGASRVTLTSLVRRGVVRLEQRDGPSAVWATRGGTEDSGGDPATGEMLRVLDGGACLHRVPSKDTFSEVAALSRSAVEQGRQVLVLVPERETAERLAGCLRRELRTGYSVAAYHSAVGRNRGVIYRCAAKGEVDVLIGTRTAALLPMRRLGAICVVDEPNEAHRAEPGYEGLPLHVREICLKRGELEGAGVLFLSPAPSLRLFASKDRVRELPARLPEDWPAVRIVDMRGSGAALSSTLIEACRHHIQDGKRVGVLVNRTGYATAVACTSCGAVRSCPVCDIPLVPYDESRRLVCPRCAYAEEAPRTCSACGSERMSPTGLAVERAREVLSEALGEPVGLVTARESRRSDAPVVVGTARYILGRDWDVVMIPDNDGLLLGSGVGAVERAFRRLYFAAEAAAEYLYVQTRVPEHYALRAAVRADYPGFASAELPRLLSLGYPPFAHLADVTLEGAEEVVRRAVESGLRSGLETGVRMTGPVPVSRTGDSPAIWRVLLRGRERAPVARGGALAARLATGTRGGMKVRVGIDPEEV